MCKSVKHKKNTTEEHCVELVKSKAHFDLAKQRLDPLNLHFWKSNIDNTWEINEVISMGPFMNVFLDWAP